MNWNELNIFNSIHQNFNSIQFNSYDLTLISIQFKSIHFWEKSWINSIQFNSWIELWTPLIQSNKIHRKHTKQHGLQTTQKQDNLASHTITTPHYASQWTIKKTKESCLCNIVHHKFSNTVKIMSVIITPAVPHKYEIQVPGIYERYQWKLPTNIGTTYHYAKTHVTAYLCAINLHSYTLDTNWKITWGIWYHPQPWNCPTAYWNGENAE